MQDLNTIEQVGLYKTGLIGVLEGVGSPCFAPRLALRKVGRGILSRVQCFPGSIGSSGLGNPGVRNGFMQHLWLYTSMYNAIGSIKYTKCPNPVSISSPESSRNYKNPLKICPYNDYLMMRQVPTLA